MDQRTQLALPSARTIPWPALAVAAALAWAIVRLGVRDGLDPRLVALPVATTLLGAWLCLLFEDRAFELTRPSPTPLWLRRGVRVAIALPPVAAAWLAVTWIGPLTGPTAPMAEMAIATGVAALACAATATRAVSPERSGVPAAGALIGIVLLLPIALALVLDRPVGVDPAHPPLGTALTYWASVTVGSLVLLVAAHRDPARRPLRRWPRRRRSAAGVVPAPAVVPAREAR